MKNEFSTMQERKLQEGSESLSELIAEFKEETATVPLSAGLALAAAGLLLLAVQLLINLHEFLLILGILWIVLGLIFVAVGTSLKKNRLLIYAEGLVQLKRGEAQPSLWKDVQKVLVEERRHYASGVCHSVNYQCKLQHNDETVTKVDVITITPRILQIIQERWEMSTASNRKRLEEPRAL